MGSEVPTDLEGTMVSGVPADSEGMVWEASAGEAPERAATGSNRYVP